MRVWGACDNHSDVITLHVEMLANAEQTSGELLTAAELAAEFRIALGTIYSWRTRKTGPPVLKIGGQLRYRRRDVDNWLEVHTEGSL